MTFPEILKASELANILGCAVTTVEERARKRELPGLKFGDGGWVFPTQATLSILNKQALAYLDEDTKTKPVAKLMSIPRSRRTLPILPSI